MCLRNARYDHRDVIRTKAWKVMLKNTEKLFWSNTGRGQYELGRIHEAVGDTDQRDFVELGQVHGGAFHVFKSLRCAAKHTNTGILFTTLVEVSVEGYVASGDNEQACYTHMRIDRVVPREEYKDFIW